jgi:quercetin dioxygenase-like cupin family protein
MLDRWMTARGGTERARTSNRETDNDSVRLRPGASFCVGGVVPEAERTKRGCRRSHAPFRLATAQWSEPYSGPLGYPKGVQRASLGTDPVSGGETYYARFPAASKFAVHWHSHAEYAVVLRGKVTHTIGKDRYPLEVGDYVVVPPKIAHGWEADASGDVFLLIRRDGPADFNFVEQ